MAIALIQNVDKVILVEQDNKFFKDMLKELKKNKIAFETIRIFESEK